MAQLQPYNNLSPNQQQEWTNIVNFGESHGFSQASINMVLLLAYAENTLNSTGSNGNAVGAFQYTPSTWKDYTSLTNYSQKGIMIFNTMYDWGYDSESNSPATFKITNPINQITVTYAEIQVLTGNARGQVLNYKLLLL